MWFDLIIEFPEFDQSSAVRNQFVYESHPHFRTINFYHPNHDTGHFLATWKRLVVEAVTKQ